MLEIILVQGFCPLKIKVTQFPDGFCLKSLPFSFIHHQGGAKGQRLPAEEHNPGYVNNFARYNSTRF